MADSAFERIAAAVDPPMMIVTARAGHDIDGCLVGFSTQCSIEPTRYLVCLSKANRTYEIARNASVLVVHMLHDDAVGMWLARLFGEVTEREPGALKKLEMCAWEPGPDETPVIAGCDWFSGPIRNRVDLGDHVGYSLDVNAGKTSAAREPYLGYSSVRHLDAGNPA
jgi:flavin reductase (DIM6/NTAB) family NADH-FMN oxidoreductase RutF